MSSCLVLVHGCYVKDSFPAITGEQPQIKKIIIRDGEAFYIVSDSVGYEYAVRVRPAFKDSPRS